jgi:Protein of unknown function (DUF4007)
MIRQLRLDTAINQIDVTPIFARHETFHPRFGWLKKGYDAVCQNPEIFLEEDAHIQLGVGKNMAKSIRYWCSAFKVIEDDRTCTASEFGTQLMNDRGYDPFLEDPASLWLLHWNILKQPCMATAWHFAFNIFRQVEFTYDDLFFALCDYRDSFASRVVESSLKKDITCILRMYVKQGAEISLNEDNLDCPFTELDLIHRAGDSKHFMFRVGQKANLPAEIIVAACLDFANWIGRGQRTISISRLLFEIGSPGMAFKLSESALCDAIERVAQWCKAIALSESAGLIQMSFTEEPTLLTQNLLDTYYSG